MSGNQQVMYDVALAVLPYVPRKTDHFSACEETHPDFGVQCRRERGHRQHHSYRDGRDGRVLNWPIQEADE